jgi:hypothetical protein
MHVLYSVRNILDLGTGSQREIAVVGVSDASSRKRRHVMWTPSGMRILDRRHLPVSARIYGIDTFEAY